MATQQLIKYLHAYNTHDLNAIASFLAPECFVVLNDVVVTNGRETMLPSYTNDWTKNPGAKVAVVGDKGIQEESFETTTHVTLDLYSNTANKVIKVTYVFRNEDLQMIEHRLLSVVEAQPPYPDGVVY